MDSRPVKVIDKELDGLSIPFATLPAGVYIRGTSCRVIFDGKRPDISDPPRPPEPPFEYLSSCPQCGSANVEQLCRTAAYTLICTTCGYQSPELWSEGGLVLGAPNTPVDPNAPWPPEPIAPLADE
jgi:hypothetical protein